MITLLRTLFLVAVLAFASAVEGVNPAFAQDVNVEDSDAFAALVDRAELTISRDRASDRALRDLRDELNSWRSALDEARSTNRLSIGAVLSQLDRLGPPPGEGETEPQSIAVVRSELNARLESLRAPGQAAEVSYNRADALISEIDQLLRARQTEALLERVQTPLWPGGWMSAWSDIRSVDVSLANEIRLAWTAPASGALMRDRLPLAMLFVGIGLVMLVAGRRVAERVTHRLQTRTTGGAQLLAFFASLLQIMVPAFGLLLIFWGASLLLSAGTLSGTILRALVSAGFLLIGARWLATQTFPAAEHAEAPVAVPDTARFRGRVLTTVLGALLALSMVLELVSGDFGFTSQTISLLYFPIVVFASFTLWRLSRLLKPASVREEDGEAGDSTPDTVFQTRVLWLLSRALVILAFLAPLAAAVGYWRLANYLVFPSIATLGVIGLLAVLHLVFRDLYAVLSRRASSDASEALVPVLLTLVLSLASIPLIALIWGARGTDILETWDVLQEGFTLGEAQIGLSSLLTIVVVFIIGFGLTRAVQSTLRSAVLPRTRIDTGGRNAITAAIGYVGITLAAVAAITVAGVDLSGLALIASALSVGIGFGLQTIVSNFVSGLILLAERPISEGDWIEVNGQMGIVKDISVRATRIETFDRTDVIVPNSDFISGTVTNWTRGNTVGRVIASVGVAYSSDSRKVEAILKEVANAHPLVALNPEPAILFRNFGADSLEFEVRCILRDVNFLLKVHSDLNHEIHRRFREEGVEIPFAQRDIWLRNPEALFPANDPPGPDAQTAD